MLSVAGQFILQMYQTFLRHLPIKIVYIGHNYPCDGPNGHNKMRANSALPATVKLSQTSPQTTKSPYLASSE